MNIDVVPVWIAGVVAHVTLSTDHVPATCCCAWRQWVDPGVSGVKTGDADVPFWVVVAPESRCHWSAVAFVPVIVNWSDVCVVDATATEGPASSVVHTAGADEVPTGRSLRA